MIGSLPSALKLHLRKWHRKAALGAAVRGLRKRVLTDPDLPSEFVERLIYGWGNEGWSASSDLARATYRYCRNLKGDVLECGSGMTTVLLAALGEAGDFRAWALEHEQPWHAHVSRHLIRHGFDASRILHTPLRSHGEFDWYDLLDVELPKHLQFVLCDGPPGGTRGGRFGMLHMLRDRLASGAVILVDDTNRDAEARMVERWLAFAPEELAVIERGNTYTALRVR